ncbi:glutamate dehydrogenase, partial [Candidatus Amoebophilus asiaticus]|nr:glutamate dehydrogenase [Candidatus Amoebophilus asiaticus]
HNVDIPAGDIGTGAREIGYLFGQYKRIKTVFTGVLTGKDMSYGGSLIRPEATGYGAVYFAEEMLKVRGDSLQGKVCVLSGSGNVAQYTLQKINKLGGKVVTVSDSGGFVFDPDGIDDEKLAFIMELKGIKRGRIKEYAEKYSCDYYPNQRPWGVKCHAAFPSATENEITGKDAETLIKNGCVCVSEGANMPSTPEAVELFLKAKILYGPGKAANAGGVAVSGLEMSQNRVREVWTREEVDEKLHKIMVEIHAKCAGFGKQKDFVNYVDGANIAGFVRVADAMVAQGLV